MSEDLLTGRVMNELRMLQEGETPEPVAALRRHDEAEEQVEVVARQAGRRRFESATGLSIVGAEPTRGAYIPGEGAPIDEPVLKPFAENGLWHLGPSRRLTSSAVIVDLDGERYAATAMLAGFIGTLVVGALGVDSLNYVPAASGEDSQNVVPAVRTRFFSSDYTEQFAAEARHAVALANAAARFGRFEVATDEASPVVRTLRKYKHYDPVLGIFAAYAYHRAGKVEEIESIIRHFVNQGQSIPFDIVMLAAQLRGLSAEQYWEDSLYRTYQPSVQDFGVLQYAPYAPFSFPLLAQGWALLGPDEALHPAVAGFRRALRPALWATAAGPAGQELFDAVARGDVA